MRVPLPIALLLSVSVIGVTWWKGTRKHRDFLTPPPQEVLDAIRAKPSVLPEPPAPLEAGLRASTPGGGTPAEPVAEPPSPAQEPEIDLGNLDTAPGLDAYLKDAAPQGAAYLARLATKLEQKGAFSRALLAWERILDAGKADDLQAQDAVAAIRRLRPTLPAWNIDPEANVSLVLHAGTAPSNVEKLKPALDAAVRTLGRASGGILVLGKDISVGKAPVGEGGPAVAPVAIWLSGPAKDSPATEVVSFTPGKPEELEQEVLRSVYQLVRARAGRLSGAIQPLDIPVDEAPADALSYRITRRVWNRIGVLLNTPPVVPPLGTTAPAPTSTGKPAATSKPPTSKPAKPAPAKPKPKPKPPASGAPAARTR